MKYRYYLGAVTLVIGSWLTGCSNTARGVQADTAQNAQNVMQASNRAGQQLAQATENAKENLDKTGQKVAQATNQEVDKLNTEASRMGQEVKEPLKNAGAALLLTPRVKTALIADYELNDPRNSIDVDSADNVVHLRGHVYDDEMKQRATQIAQKALNEAKSTDTLSNELMISRS